MRLLTLCCVCCCRPSLLQSAEVPPNAHEMAACVDWGNEACGALGTFDWSKKTEQWSIDAKAELEKNAKTWADKQLKTGDVEGAVLSYEAAMRYAGDGASG